MLVKVMLLVLMLMLVLVLMVLLLLLLLLGRQQRVGFLLLLDHNEGARLGRGSTPGGPLMLRIAQHSGWT